MKLIVRHLIFQTQSKTFLCYNINFIFSASSEVQATIEPVPSSSTSQKRQFDDTDVLNDDVLSKRTKLENVILQEEVEIAVESQADEEITGKNRGKWLR